MELGDELASRGLPVFDRFSQGRLDTSVFPRLVDLFRSQQIQIVCTVGTGGDRSFWGRLAGWWSKVPVVLSCPHSMGLPDRSETTNRMLSGITDGFIAVAHRQKRYLVKNEGFSASKVHVIHNGVDLERFVPRERELAVRRAHGIPDTAPLAGLVACLRPEKDVAAFVRAALLVRQQIPNAHFVVVGDGPERPRLEKLTCELGANGWLHFAGMCPDVRPWLAAMDVLALTSVCEAFPVSLLEAMACGRPVVATRVGAISEMVTSGKAGILVAAGNVPKIAQALAGLMADPIAARVMGQAARRHAEQHFGLEGMVHGYESLFLRLLSSRRSRARSSAHSC